MSQTAKKKLQVVQNKLIRFMLNLGPSDHIGIEQLNTLGLLNVVDRADQLNYTMPTKFSVNKHLFI